MIRNDHEVRRVGEAALLESVDQPAERRVEFSQRGVEFL